MPNASLRAFGQDGDYWSSVAHELVNLTWATAWFLGNYAGSIDSNGTTNARSFGFPIRCLYAGVLRVKGAYVFQKRKVI